MKLKEISGPSIGAPFGAATPSPSHLVSHSLDGKIQVEGVFPGCPVLPQSPHEGKDGSGLSPLHSPACPPMLRVLKAKKKEQKEGLPWWPRG